MNTHSLGDHCCPLPLAVKEKQYSTVVKSTHSGLWNEFLPCHILLIPQDESENEGH